MGQTNLAEPELEYNKEKSGKTRATRKANF